MTYDIFQLASIKLGVKEMYKHVKQWHSSISFEKYIFK